MDTVRKQLSAKGLLGTVREVFSKIEAPNNTESESKAKQITLTDCLMSGVAVFGLKFPSLLKFDENRNETNIRHNLRTLYQVKTAPCDTYLRRRCDEVDPSEIRKAFKKVFAVAQRGKILEQFTYLDGHYLLSGDGTGFFSSKKVHCKNCCVKHHKMCHIKFMLNLLPVNIKHLKKNTYVLTKNIGTGWELYYIDCSRKKIIIDINDVKGLHEILLDKPKKKLSGVERNMVREVITSYYLSQHPEEELTYYHNMFCAAIVHPDMSTALPLAPEPIVKSDGMKKNDCERNASRRLYTDARREHPHLKLIIVEDSLGSNVPHLKDLHALDMRYIIGVKPGSHQFLFDTTAKLPCIEYSHTTEDGVTHHYRYINEVQLNKSHADFKVNFLAYRQTNKNGEEKQFSWITDIKITNENVYQIMRGGRSNWRIENNTFNTLKNQGYHFSHNFGHGYKNLSTVFGMLMMLAFFVDQLQGLACRLFQKARAKYNSLTSLWEKIRGMFQEHLINSWEDVFNAIANGRVATPLVPNTS